jgi:hypothetical protein
MAWLWLGFRDVLENQNIRSAEMINDNHTRGDILS